MDLTEFVGNLALVCTIAANFAGLQICMKIFHAKSTGNISALPFITATACSALWLHYGILIQDHVIVIVNAIAFSLQSIYTGCYYLFTANKRILHKQLLILGWLLFMYLAYAVVYMGNNPVLITSVVGILACTGSLTACASPLASVQDVFKTKSTEVLPFPIIFSAFIVCLLWFVYGILKNDVFLQVPNFIGVLLSGFQLSLFTIYPRKSNRQD